MKFIVILKNEIKKFYLDVEGTYVLTTNGDFENADENRKNWMQENGINAIWFDKENNSWNIGDKGNIGTDKCKIKAEAIDANKEPCEIKEWKYFEDLGFEWVTSKDVVIQGIQVLYSTIDIKKN